MRARIDDIVFGDIYRTRENIGRHVGNQADVQVRILAQLCSVDLVICRKVELIVILSDLEVLWDIGVILILR